MIFNQFCFLVSLWACSTTPIVALSSGAARLDAPQPPLEVDCAIIGGGPAGLAAAIAYRNHRHHLPSPSSKEISFNQRVQAFKSQNQAGNQLLNLILPFWIN
jgi:hypothetical protein